MKSPKRVNACLKIIRQQQDLVDISTNEKSEVNKKYKNDLLILAKNIQYLSVEKKQHRIRLANKILKRNAMSLMTKTLWGRIKLAFKYIITGDLI